MKKMKKKFVLTVWFDQLSHSGFAVEYVIKNKS